jgi:hypothetical protein
MFRTLLICTCRYLSIWCRGESLTAVRVVNILIHVLPLDLDILQGNGDPSEPLHVTNARKCF